jgi:uncharacterized CHY-type Zn-finger protein
MTNKLTTRPAVCGVELDPETRCAHYRSPLDIIAIKMRCCETYYACRECHDELADHAAQVWPRETWDSAAILCGACGTTLTIHQYLQSENRCPACGGRFNPGCRNHYHLYFEAI